MPSYSELIKKGQQEQVSAQSKVEGVSDTSEGPTLREILANKQQQELFGEFLSRGSDQGERNDQIVKSDKELAQRLLKGELEQDDIGTLAERRDQFVQVLERSKNLRELLAKENIGEIISTSPELQKIAGLIGPERIREVVTGQIERLSIKNPEQFNLLKTSLDSLIESRRVEKQRNVEISALCKKYNVSEKELHEIFSKKYLDNQGQEIINGVDSLKKADLERIIRERMNWDEKMSLWIRGGLGEKISISGVTDERVEKLTEGVKGATGKESIEELVRVLEESTIEFGKALSTAASTNPDIRKAMASVLKSKNPEQGRRITSSFMDLLDFVNGFPSIDELIKNVMIEWGKYKTNNGVKTVGNNHRETFKNQFLESKMKNYTGPWIDMFISFISSQIEFDKLN